MNFFRNVRVPVISVYVRTKVPDGVHQQLLFKIFIRHATVFFVEQSQHKKKVAQQVLMKEWQCCT